MCPFSRQRGNSIYFLLFFQSVACTVDQVTISQLFAINNVVTVLQFCMSSVYRSYITRIGQQIWETCHQLRIKPASTNARHIKTDVVIRPVLAYHSNKLAHPMACGETPRGAAFNQSQ